VATSPKERGVAFGGYRFEGDSGRLWSGAREIRLTPKAAAVLEQLVRQAGEPVSKERLFETVWNGTAVSDDALTSCSQATAAEQGCRSATPASSPKTRGKVISMPC
jgi:DNA-binding response OmpR family regulator